jgi:hypothetical protein
MTFITSILRRILTYYVTIGYISWLPGDRGSIPGRGKKIFLLASVSWPALGPTQPPVQWVPTVLSPGVTRGRGVTLTTQLHLLPRSWISRSYTSSPPYASIGVLWDCSTLYISLFYPSCPSSLISAFQIYPRPFYLNVFFIQFYCHLIFHRLNSSFVYSVNWILIQHHVLSLVTPFCKSYRHKSPETINTLRVCRRHTLINIT